MSTSTNTNTKTNTNTATANRFVWSIDDIEVEDDESEGTEPVS